MSAELAEARAKLAQTPCPEWCDMPQHAETRSGSWHEGATSAIPVTAGGSPLYCEVTEGHDMGDAWDLRLSICADAGKVHRSGGPGVRRRDPPCRGATRAAYSESLPESSHLEIGRLPPDGRPCPVAAPERGRPLIGQ